MTKLAPQDDNTLEQLDQKPLEKTQVKEDEGFKVMLKNVSNKLPSLKAASKDEIQSTISALSGNDLDPYSEDILKNLEEIAKKIEAEEAAKAVEAAKAAAVQAEITRKLEEEKLAQEKEREKEWDNDPRRGEWIKAKIEAAYKEFDKVNEPRLKKIRKKNTILDDAIRAIAAGEPPNAEHEEVLRPKTPGELEQERQEQEDLRRIEEIAARDHAYHDAGHKEAGEKITQLEERRQRHKDAGDHNAAAAVEKEMETHVHRKKYHVEGKKTAGAKLDKVRETKEEYEREGQKLEALKEKAATAKDPTWGGILVVNAVENKKVYNKPVDKQDIKNEVEELQDNAILDREQKKQEMQIPDPKPAIPFESKVAQPPLDPPLQSPKENKDALESDQRQAFPVATSATPNALATAKKQEREVSDSQAVATKGASIVNSVKDHAKVSKGAASLQVKPEGGVNALENTPPERDL